VKAVVILGLQSLFTACDMLVFVASSDTWRVTVQCIGVAGEVQGVFESGTVVVKYENLDKRWHINPELLDKTVSENTTLRQFCKKWSSVCTV